MYKPIIGIVPLWDEKKNSLWMLPGYLEGIEKAGGLPIILPLTTDEESMIQICGMCDGFLFTGGHDVATELYNQNPLPQCGRPCRERDRMEEVLFVKAVRELNKPAFGICRGIQLFNVILGGTLYQDLPAQYDSRINHQQDPPYNRPVHTVKIISGTPLEQLLGREELPVNSYHHQAVDRLADELRPLAISEDGLTEAVYMPERKFVCGVQWHPELMVDDQSSRLLFGVFVQACRSAEEVSFNIFKRKVVSL